MKIRSTIGAAGAALYFLVSAPTHGAAQALASPIGPTLGAPDQLSGPSTWPERAALIEPDALRRPVSSDSTARLSRRAAIVGGVIGAVVGGLSSAAYALNATAYRCTTVGLSCSSGPHTGWRVAVISAGTTAGAALGAWIGYRFAK